MGNMPKHLSLLHLSNIVCGAIPKHLQRESILNLSEVFTPQIHLNIAWSLLLSHTLCSFPNIYQEILHANIENLFTGFDVDITICQEWQ